MRKGHFVCDACHTGGMDSLIAICLNSKSANPIEILEEMMSMPACHMHGKNLTFKTSGVDGCNCEETLKLIAEGKLDTEPLITHTYPLSKIDEAYELFENKRDGVIKVAVEC